MGDITLEENEQVLQEIGSFATHHDFWAGVDDLTKCMQHDITSRDHIAMPYVITDPDEDELEGLRQMAERPRIDPAVFTEHRKPVVPFVKVCTMGCTSHQLTCPSRRRRWAEYPVAFWGCVVFRAVFKGDVAHHALQSMLPDHHPSHHISLSSHRQPLV